MATGQIREIGEADEAAWDAFVAAHPLGSAFVTMASRAWWNASGWQLRALALFEGDRIVAGLPFSLKRVPHTPFRFARLPAILVSQEDRTKNAAALMEAADEVFRSSHVVEVGTRLNIYVGQFVRGVRYDDWFRDFLQRFAYVKTPYSFGTYLIPLGADDEALLQSFSKRCRKDVRRGLARGVEVACSEDPADFRTFVETHRAMTHRKGLAPASESGCQAMAPLFERGYLRLFVARHEGRFCNTVIVDALGTPRGMMSAAANVVKDEDVPPTGEAMRYFVLRWLRDHGAECFDFGGAPGPDPVEGHPNYNVWRFKAGFQGQFAHTLPVFRRPYGRLAHHVLEMVRRTKPASSPSRHMIVDIGEVFWLQSETSPSPSAVAGRSQSSRRQGSGAPSAGPDSKETKANDMAEAYDVSLWTEAADERWDAFVASHPLGQGAVTSAASQLWMGYGWSIQWLVAMKEGAIAAGLALGVKYSRLSPAPLVRVEAVFPLASDVVGSVGALIKRAELEARTLGAMGLQTTCRIYDKFPIRGVEYAAGVEEVLRDRGFKLLGKRKGTYILDVEKDDEALLEGVGTKCRRDIRKGLREGVKVVNLEGMENLTFFGEVHARMLTRKKLAGAGSKDLLRLERLSEPFRRGFIRLFGAEVNSEIVNMALVDVLGVARWRVGAAAESALSKGMPPTGQALQYGIMQWLRDHQVKYYDLGGAPGPVPIEKHSNYGVWRFKSEFNGAYVETIPQYLKPLKIYGSLAVRLAQRLGFMES
jgi:lipid II:glycine glycyltransferase (peptidoglycan interpeptide bridge formation enzyme)